MIQRRHLLLLILIFLIILSVFAFQQIKINHDGPQSDNSTADTITHEIIGNDSTGSVEVIRNLGNPNGSKIAYVVGVHPLENDTHRTFLNMMPTLTDLNHCYDVYVINVTEDFSSYGQLHPDDEPGRQTGQDLALKYVYPAIVNGSYKFAVDVHAHGGAYPYGTFVFSPVDGGLGEAYGRNVSNHTQNVSYYNPYHTTSGPYLTIPLNENGVPAIYFEENSFYSQAVKDSHMMELIHAVDSLNV